MDQAGDKYVKWEGRNIEGEKRKSGEWNNRTVYSFCKYTQVNFLSFFSILFFFFNVVPNQANHCFLHLVKFLMTYIAQFKSYGIWLGKGFIILFLQIRNLRLRNLENFWKAAVMFRRQRFKNHILWIQISCWFPLHGAASTALNAQEVDQTTHSSKSYLLCARGYSKH